MPHVSMDCGFLGERDSEEQISLVLSFANGGTRRRGRCWLQGRGQSSPGSPRERQHSSISSNTTGSRSHAAMKQRSKRWREKSRKLASASERKPVQRDHRACGGGSLPARQEHRKLRWNTVLGAGVPPDARILCSLEFAENLMNRCDVGSDGKTPLQKLHAEETVLRSWNLERRSCTCLPSRNVGAAIPFWSVRWNAQLVVRGSGCHRARNGDQDTHSQQH